MNQDQHASASPFSALSYQEQQDRWLEWRSRQLNYQPADAESAVPPASPIPPAPSAPRLRLPNMPIAAPVQHQQLDQVLNRHAQARKRAGAFQSTSIGPAHPSIPSSDE